MAILILMFYTCNLTYYGITGHWAMWIGPAIYAPFATKLILNECGTTSFFAAILACATIAMRPMPVFITYALLSSLNYREGLPYAVPLLRAA